MQLEALISVFEWGVDYGLLLAEQERDSEDLADAFLCMAYSRKYNVPSSPAQRRQPHSREWREQKAQAVKNFISFVAQNKEIEKSRT